MEKGVSVILYTLEKNSKKTIKNKIKVYAGITLFCAAFFLIYDQFSHGVRSPYMTFLFLWPLVLGLFPYLLLYYFTRFRQPDKLAENLYHPGVACLTVGSVLRGIFDIAGTTSDYQHYLMIVGYGFLIAGLAAYIVKR